MDEPVDLRSQASLLVHEVAHDLPGAYLHMEELVLLLSDSLALLKGLGEADGALEIVRANLMQGIESTKTALAFLETSRATIDNLKRAYGAGTGVRASAQGVAVWGVVEQCVDLLRRQAHDMEFRCNLKGQPFVTAYESELRRACLNVLLNAVKYSFHRGRAQTPRFIMVQGRPWKTTGFSLSVTSYGVGVLEDEIEAVLLPGRRGRLAIADQKIGSGLGLAEAARILARHRGDVDLRSELMTDEIAERDFAALMIEDRQKALRLPWKTTVTLRALGVMEGQRA